MKEMLLTKPIMAHNEKIHVLELREPTYEEIEKIGFPFDVSADGALKMDSSVTLKYIPLLASIPRSSASQMSLIDIFKVSMVVVSFFSGSAEEKTSGSESSTSPTSGD
ncbi:phage tail assembly protein [Enterobacter asburiae]|uniref:phage tail assembly protein n=1 Tax=Enterobacter asburiae TaxID=61645 RepID=UPI00192A995C|nr:phage tail assembly protein [Enterobacter asburiae]MBL5911226.1 phage tail assembly protein [Enterobacter asburiae]